MLVAVGEGIDVTVAGVELGYDLPKPVTIALMIGGLSSFLGGQHANHRDMRRDYRSDDQ
jgi:hypothetical protein